MFSSRHLTKNISHYYVCKFFQNYVVAATSKKYRDGLLILVAEKQSHKGILLLKRAYKRISAIFFSQISSTKQKYRFRLPWTIIFALGLHQVCKSVNWIPMTNFANTSIVLFNWTSEEVSVYGRHFSKPQGTNLGY